MVLIARLPLPLFSPALSPSYSLLSPLVFISLRLSARLSLSSPSSASSSSLARPLYLSVCLFTPVLVLRLSYSIIFLPFFLTISFLNFLLLFFIFFCIFSCCHKWFYFCDATLIKLHFFHTHSSFITQSSIAIIKAQSSVIPRRAPRPLSLTTHTKHQVNNGINSSSNWAADKWLELSESR